MAKIARDAALVLGAVALAATGYGLAVDATVGLGGAAVIGTVATTTISSVAGFSAALAGGLASLLTKKPAPIANPMGWQSDPQAGLPIVAGRAYSAGKIFLRTVSGDNNNAQSIHSCYSIGPVQSMPQLYIDSIARSIDGSGNASVPDYGKVVITTQTGLQPQPSAFGFWDSTPGLSAASKVSGLAAAAIRLYYDTKGKNTMTTEPAIGFVVQGVRVYDPRKDSTYPGGNGSQRWNDETTWSWAGYDNPYLFGLAWLIGWRQNGKLVAGVGMPISAIIVAQFVEGANVADANKWTMGGVLDTTDDKWNRLKDILQAGGGVPMRLGAQVGCIINTPKTSLATITIDDVVGDATVQATQAQRDRINAVIPRYMAELDNTVPDPSQPADSEGNYPLITNVTWAMVAASPVVVSDYVTFDGKQRQKQIDYAFVQNLTQAQQLARYDIENAREFGPISLPLKLRWMGYKPGDVVTCNLPELGLNGQDILLLQRELSPSDMTVTMTARSETAAKHAFALGQTGTAPATPTVTGPAVIPTPAASAWTLSGGTLTSVNGTTIPVLQIVGTVDSSVVDAIVFQYRTSATANAQAGSWIDVGTQAPSIELLNITGVQDAIPYDVSIAYRKGPGTGTALILGPATAGQTSVPYQTGVTGPKPAIDADNTATVFAAAGSDPARLVSDVNLNAETLLSYQYGQQTLTDYMNGYLFVAGVPVNTAVTNETNQRIAGDTAIAQTIALIGAKNSSGSAFALNLTTAQVGNGLSLADRLGQIDTNASGLVTTNQNLAAVAQTANSAAQGVSNVTTQINTLTSNLGTANATITSIQEVVTTPTGGASAKAVFQLGSNGHVVGYAATNDGSTGAIVFDFDSFTLMTPSGTTLFNADSSGVKMHSVEVDTIKVGTGGVSIPPVGLQSAQSYTGSGSAPSSNMQVTSSVTLTFTAQVSVLMTMSGAMAYSGNNADYGADLLVTGKTASGSAISPGTFCNSAAGAGYPIPSFSGIGAVTLAPGTYTFATRWRGSSGVTLNYEEAILLPVYTGN